MRIIIIQKIILIAVCACVLHIAFRVIRVNCSTIIIIVHLIARLVFVSKYRIYVMYWSREGMGWEMGNLLEKNNI